jgi:hypothetical protein
VVRKTLFIESLPASLFQREGNVPFMKMGLRGMYPSLAKRGKGRFFDLYKSDFETLDNL